MMMDSDSDESLEEIEYDVTNSDNEEMLESMAESLESQVTQNVFLYDSHVHLINVLKQVADLERLRTARSRMSDHFPLTSELWLDWLDDEVKIAVTDNEKKMVLELFERAVKDYLSVEIWLKYMEFAKDVYGYESETGMNEVRTICERSLTSAGLHVPKASALWNFYIDYEKGGLEKVKDNKDLYLNQLKLIGNLYKRLLSCPLMDIDKSYDNFCSWLDKQGEYKDKIIDKNTVDNIYKTTKEKWMKIRVFEEALVSDEMDVIRHYKLYIEHEKSKAGSPVRVQYLFERMMSEFCLNEELWVDYINYVSTVLKNADVVLDVVQRSLRNCPWSCTLHQLHILSLEKYNHSHKEISEAFEQAVASGLKVSHNFRDVWMTYLEYLRRRYDAPEITKEEEDRRLVELRAAFEKAVEFLSRLSGKSPNTSREGWNDHGVDCLWSNMRKSVCQKPTHRGQKTQFLCFNSQLRTVKNNLQNSDPEYQVVQFWARIEANHCKNMEKCRLLWNDILSNYNLKTSDMWLEYINIERAFGDSKHLRKLLVRALQSTRDFPERVAKYWMNYERDEGTLESYQDCLDKIESRLNQIREQRQLEAAKKLAEKEATRKKSKWAGSGPKKGNAFSQSHSESNANKSQGVKRKHEDNGKNDESPEKKSKSEGNEELVDKLLQETTAGHGVTVVHDSSKDNRTVFVSNLDFATEESTIRGTFEPCGKITDLRLVKDYKGRSKGYCFVEFEKPSEALIGLKKDREMIDGRPMYVSKCDPDSETREKVFRFSSGLEKNKLFVRGLPFDATEIDLRTLYEKYGALKGVRLVTYKNGRSKGLAYVEFADEESAANALIATNGMMIGGRTITVAISNPPERSETGKSTSSLGAGSSGPRKTGRKQLSFVPRSVQLKASGPAEPIAGTSLQSPQGEEQPKKMSNADFRSMLNK